MITCILILLSMACQSQANTFDSVVNKLQFHVFTNNVDTCVLPFLKRCVAVLSEKPPPAEGGWTMYPPEFPTPQDGMLSIKVAQHPSLHCKHSGARFDILTQEWQDSRPGIRALRVWFYFDSKAEADTALKILVEMFRSTNTEARVMPQTKVQTVILNETGKDAWQSAKLILLKEKDEKPKYSILFIYGSDTGESW